MLQRREKADYKSHLLYCSPPSFVLMEDASIHDHERTIPSRAIELEWKWKCGHLSNSTKPANQFIIRLSDLYFWQSKTLLGKAVINKDIVSHVPSSHQWLWTLFLRVPDCWLLVVVGMEPLSGWQEEVCHSSIKISSPTPGPKWRKLFFVGSQSYLLTISFILTNMTRLNDVLQGLCSASLELFSF